MISFDADGSDGDGGSSGRGGDGVVMAVIVDYHQCGAENKKTRDCFISVYLISLFVQNRKYTNKQILKIHTFIRAHSLSDVVTANVRGAQGSIASKR